MTGQPLPIEAQSTVSTTTETGANAVVSTSNHRADAAAAVPPTAPASTWTIEASEELYRIAGWGEPYFGINAAGNITVSPKGLRGGSLDLYDLVQGLMQRNLELPLLIRFSDILEDRIERLNAAFAKAIARYNYDGLYRGVFPVKCNQQRHLIENLVRFGQPYQFGLEAGSKPELMIALASLTTAGALLICNGYKDREYIETALLGQQLGQTVIIVLEQIEEVALVIETSQRLGIKPVVGVRAKLSAKGIGRWGDSAGDRAKFGLTIPEILQAVSDLKAAGLLDCLQLLHFHIGSQISSISVLKDAMREAGQIYVELVRLDANMQYLDVGGGLGVDYDGSRSSFHASKNYNTQNYANDVVAAIKDACTLAEIPGPTLISESGRAVSSHQSVLIFDVLGTNEVHVDVPVAPHADEHRLIHNLYETYELIAPENVQETYNDATQFKDEALSSFTLGYLSLPERARAEQLYWDCCKKIQTIVPTLEDVPEELADLEKIMASMYYVNLSVFQSAPDSWAIDQLFPITPIHRLNEAPDCRATLADLTCDSDGKIDRFIGSRDVKSVLELHSLKPDEPYYLGMFLNGAYQEIMGNLHNLFGDTNVVHISLTPKGYQIDHVVRGDTMKEVLGYVQYHTDDLIESIRQKTEAAIDTGHISLHESQLLLNCYKRCLGAYTYLSSMQ
ncbi:biosynthetic arginine decarboxylase [filamentous cyanobacterium LEGE 11480]|uniref:Biosynthetic arginine decarboxylase n=1 Tax=Romeriopsis navalis LEGE 11480 TaxID=2777977 RepID=A0A928VPM3_9CYAN|nr:biosynthetic arginine decarboxylase [Romeriopsis navalis]MBE9030295.1 biosynthetic arginine decarboxylase [Romeriopsis navalis LEGE 11480]